MSIPPRRRFQVVIKTELREHKRRLAEIEEWLREWRLPCLLSGSDRTGIIRAAFSLDGHARALELQYGGRRLSGVELDAAISEDELHDALLERAADFRPGSP